MSVTWNTYSSISTPSVKYGTDPLSLTSTATGSSVIYPTSRTYTHTVVIKGLKPGTQYYYQVSNTDCYSCSEIPTYVFRTARAAGDSTPYSIAFTVDVGVQGPLGLSANLGKSHHLSSSHLISPRAYIHVYTFIYMLQQYDTLLCSSRCHRLT
jgi:hypothetical protein